MFKQNKCSSRENPRSQYGLETEVAKHLADNYGDRAWAVASLAEASGKRWPLHGVRLNPNYPCKPLYQSWLSDATHPRIGFFRHRG